MKAKIFLLLLLLAACEQPVQETNQQTEVYEIVFSPEEPYANQTITFALDNPQEEVMWYIDDQPISQPTIELPAGLHTVKANVTSSEGEVTISAEIEVFPKGYAYKPVNQSKPSTGMINELAFNEDGVLAVAHTYHKALQTYELQEEQLLLTAEPEEPVIDETKWPQGMDLYQETRYVSWKGNDLLVQASMIPRITAYRYEQNQLVKQFSTTGDTESIPINKIAWDADDIVVTTIGGAVQKLSTENNRLIRDDYRNVRAQGPVHYLQSHHQAGKQQILIGVDNGVDFLEWTEINPQEQDWTIGVQDPPKHQAMYISKHVIETNKPKPAMIKIDNQLLIADDRLKLYEIQEQRLQLVAHKESPSGIVELKKSPYGVLARTKNQTTRQVDFYEIRLDQEQIDVTPLPSLDTQISIHKTAVYKDYLVIGGDEWAGKNHSLQLFKRTAIPRIDE